MKLIFEIASDEDSKGTKEYAVVVRGQFPITKYSNAIILEDGLIKLVNQNFKNQKKSQQKRKMRIKN